MIYIILIIICVFIFLKYYPPFGSTPSKRKQKEYALRAINYKKGKFYNEHDYQRIYRKPQENHYLSTKEIKPVNNIPIIKTKINNHVSLSITWLGHSSIHIQMHNINILIDPVLSKNASPLPFIGANRFSDIPIISLSKIDIIFITHDHFDHLDYQTIKKLDNKVNKYIVPLGVENHLIRWGVSKKKISCLSWWENIDINGLKVICTPARHNSSRNFILDSYKTLWASWVIMDENHKIFVSGDTGFDTHFEEIHNRFGSFDIAFLECGQYNTKWKSSHMTPEETVLAGKILNAKTIIPIHWGTFHLAKHPWDDSIERFILQSDKENIHYLTPMIGENINYDVTISTTKWWRNIKN